jgi:hypothetical protein
MAPAAVSTLALLEARVLLVDDVDAALPADHLAIRRAAFNGSANSHNIFVKKGDCTSGNGDEKASTP